MQPAESGKASRGVEGCLEVGEHINPVKDGMFQLRDPQNGTPTLHAGQAMVNMLQEYATNSTHTHRV